MQIQIKGIKGGRDRRGLVSLTYRYLFTDATVDDALLASLPNTPSLPEVNRQFVEWEVDNNGFLIDGTFEGILNEPEADQDQYQVNGDWREEPIEAFPYRALLESKYGAYEEDGRLKFPEFITSSRGGSGIGGSAQEKNPLFGIDSYPVQRLVASHSYVRKRVPRSVYQNAGKVVKSLPSGFEDPPQRTWITDPPKTQKRGNSWTIVESWKEVDNLKHLEALYLLLSAKS